MNLLLLQKDKHLYEGTEMPQVLGWPLKGSALQYLLIPAWTAAYPDLLQLKRDQQSTSHMIPKCLPTDCQPWGNRGPCA